MSGFHRTDRTIRVDTAPDLRTLNRFGFVWLGFLTLFGALAWWKADSNMAVGLWVAAIVVPLLGWAFPSFMRLVFVGLSYVAWPMGWVVSHVVLAAVFFLIVTPIGVILRVLSRPPLDRSLEAEAPTYWTIRQGETPASRYFRQF